MLPIETTGEQRMIVAAKSNSLHRRETSIANTDRGAATQIEEESVKMTFPRIFDTMFAKRVDEVGDTRY